MIEWSPSKIKAFQETLLAWYDKEKRDLPWRRDHAPYHVWISEIMLQQTQVQTVIPYYERFMAQFPTVETLANAKESDLMKAWEGLGYYSRARNLQRAAQQLVTDHHGVWPTTAEGLRELAGIGPYTAGAIASIAFGQPVPAVDGNAFRVFSRLLEIDDDIAKPKTRAVFEAAIQRMMPADRPGDFNQAIMDLGSSYMTAKNPDSAHSPVKAFNQAYLDGIEDQFPVKTKKPRPVPVDLLALVIRRGDQFLLLKRPKSGLLAGFWTFPMVDVAELQAASKRDLVLESDLSRALQKWAMDEFKLSLTAIGFTGGQQVTHTFTHRKWRISLVVADLAADADLSYFPGQWLTPTLVAKTAFPKVQTKLFDQARALKLIE
ncbi:A/G-specific adenine glycosylase [uncultured Secundilactobacillus sp.]|uniref:A/G-specific adenine glycosylase n=1 Tax=uncultured Secundilactobacillus sp. TaxID=2813935 RepID=UPI002582B6B6|nr:A/G-specific adenine glycosylase [uncultured Secundilactobacillus sp.]